MLGVQLMHKNKILHRNLKPELILLGNNGKIKIGGFRIEKIFSSDLEKTYTQIGTVHYMSPELV